MACEIADPMHRRVLRGVARDVRSLLTGAVGAAVIAAGIVLQDPALAVPCVVMGCGIVLLAIMLPTLSQFELGPSGVKVKRRLREQVEQRVAAFPPERAQHVHGLALLLFGDAETARSFAEKAIGAENGSGRLPPAERRGEAARCWVVWYALQYADPLTAARAVPADAAYARVAARAAPLTDVRMRAAWLLRSWDRLSDQAIAEILHSDERTVRSLLAEADTYLTVGAAPESPG